jgi:hypothetical protein
MSSDFRLIKKDANGVFQYFFDGVSKVSGKEKLIQKILMALFTQTNSNLYNIDYGSRTFNSKLTYQANNIEEVKTSILFDINNLKDTILRNQINTNIPDSERLEDLVVLNIALEEYSNTFKVVLQVVSALTNTIITV